ncbi:MAG: sulfatase [Myxococcales bacterium]|nr:sulfatase [Myxococcales bacterium]
MIRALAAALVGAGLTLTLDRLAAARLPAPLGLSAALALGAGVLLAHTTLALVGGLLASLRLRARPHPRLLAAATALLFAGVALWPLLQVSAALVAGDWVARQPWAPQLRWGVVAGGALAAALVGALHASGQRRRIWPALLLTGAAAAAVADGWVLPGLYAPVHLFLAGLSLALAHLGVGRLAASLAQRRPRLATGLAALAVLALAATPFALRKQGAKARAALLLASPLGQSAVPLVSRPDRAALLRLVLAHLDPATADAQPAAVEAAGERPVQDWNVLVVVVDTLRADALPPNRGAGQPFAKPGDTPRLDAWLKTAHVFPRAYAPASRTQFSMPAFARSTHPFEDPKRLGRPLARVMRSHGRIPLAVVPQYFLLSMDERVSDLLDGYDDVGVYELPRQQDWRPLLEASLDRVGDRPFFGWLHFYAMHKPGFAGVRMGRHHGDWPTRYRRSLTWLDGQWGALLALLEARGLRENTLIVLTSDHGEALGEGGHMGHGASVADHQVRVPLALFVPGLPPGAPSPATVGTVDVVPTILDLIGAEPEPTHRGHSLRPLLTDPVAPWDVAYSLTNGDGRVQGLVAGTDKIVYRPGAEVVMRFDLATDAAEAEDVFDPAGALDRGLARRLLLRNGPLAQRLLRRASDDTARQMVSGLLEAVPPAGAGDLGETLPFLLGLAAASPRAADHAQVEALFQAGDDRARRMIMGAYFAARPGPLGALMRARLDEVAGTPAEVELLRGLARQGQPAFEPAFAAAQIRAAVDAGDLSRLDAWLALTARWDKHAKRFGPALAAAMTAAASSGEGAGGWPSPLLRRLLANIATTRTGVPSASADAIQPHLVPLLDHPDRQVAIAAAEAIAANRRPASAAPLRAALAPAVDVRLRKAALAALVAVDGAAAVPDLVTQGEDPLLTVDAAELLKTLGPEAKAAVPFLERIRSSHYMGYARRVAQGALEAIEPGRVKPKAAKSARPARER